MSFFDWLYAFEPRQVLAVVLGLSIVVYALASNLAWSNRTPRAIGRWGKFLVWTHTARVARIIGELVRWVYYLGVPYAALMLGYTTVRALGIWGMDWGGTLILFAILGTGSLLVLVWVWRPYARSEHPYAIDESGWNWARHIVEIFYQEAHWAFYRSGPILWLGDFYWGSFIGLALAFIEGWSNPFVRANTRDITRADAPMWSASLAIVSTIIFVFTQNAWYALIVHLVVDLGLRAMIGFPRAHTPSDSSALE